MKSVVDVKALQRKTKAVRTRRVNVEKKRLAQEREQELQKAQQHFDAIIEELPEKMHQAARDGEYSVEVLSNATDKNYAHDVCKLFYHWSLEQEGDLQVRVSHFDDTGLDCTHNATVYSVYIEWKEKELPPSSSLW